MKHASQRGQSLIELLIAVTVGGILVASAAFLMAVSVRISTQNKFLQAASFLAQDLTDKATVYADRQWYDPTVSGTHGISNLTQDGATHYHLDTTSSSFSWVAGDETIIVDDVTYTRYFTLLKACRFIVGPSVGTIYNAVPAATTCSHSLEDPSTIHITAIVSWPGGGDVRVAKYLARNQNSVFAQTDWSGGAASPPDVLVKPNRRFASCLNVDFQTNTGEISVLAPGAVSQCP